MKITLCWDCIWEHLGKSLPVTRPITWKSKNLHKITLLVMFCFPHLCHSSLSQTAQPEQYNFKLLWENVSIFHFPSVLRLILCCQHVAYLPRLVQPFQQQRKNCLQGFFQYFQKTTDTSESCLLPWFQLPVYAAELQAYTRLADRVVSSLWNCLCIFLAKIFL